MSAQCEFDCEQHTGEAYAVRVSGLGISDKVVLCQAARDEQRENGFKVDAVEEAEESRPCVKRPVPLRLSWRLDAMNRLVADATRAIEMNRRTVGKSEIDRRSVVAVEMMLQRILQSVREVRNGVAGDVAELAGGDEDLAVLVKETGS